MGRGDVGVRRGRGAELGALTRAGQTRVEADERVEHGAHLRHLVGAEDTGAAEAGEHGEHRLGLTELVLEQVERVRERVADREPERAQPEGLQEHPGLVCAAHPRVDEVAVVEAEARVDDDPLDPAVARTRDALLEVRDEPRQRIGLALDVGDVADVAAGDAAQHEGRPVLRDEGEHVVLGRPHR